MQLFDRVETPSKIPQEHSHQGKAKELAKAIARKAETSNDSELHNAKNGSQLKMR